MAAANVTSTDLRFRVPHLSSGISTESHANHGVTRTNSLRFSVPAARGNAGIPILHPPVSSVLSDEELFLLDRSRVLTTPSPEVKDRIVLKASAKLAQLELMKPCAVCEMAFASNEVIAVPLSDTLLQAMKKHLTPGSHDISQHVLRQYDASAIDSRLSGILLYPPGVLQEPRVNLLMCSNCHDCLNKQNATLPRMAIANGNYIGWYEHEELSWLDEQMVALVSACVSMTSIAGGKQRCIRSHHYIVKNTAGPPVCMLPENAADHIRVAMVGAMTPDQVLKCKKRYAVNVQRCKQALEFLCNEHASYKAESVRVSGQARLDSSQQVDVLIDRTRDSPHPAHEAHVEDMEDTTSYSIPDSTRSSDPSVENQWIEERTVLLDDRSQSSDFFFRKSNVFESPRRWEQVVKMFPLLFPGGKGGPSEPRKNQYSLRTWVIRCLRLHKNRFEKHEVFLLLAFDYLALEAARQRMFIRLKASTDAVVAGQVTPAVLKECMDYRRHLEEATATGVQPRPPSSTIASILKLQRGVYAGEVGYYASDKSRTHGRNDIFGYISRLGPLQLFFTISPDSAGTYTISCSSGSLNPDTVKRANAHMLPTRTTRRATATTHPFQCAVYFEKIMNIVIEDVLGWCPERQRPKRRGGLFGIVRAFAASAETQVSGDLHAHFAVWLHGFPTSAAANEEALKDPTYRNALAKFVDCISKTTLPGVTDNCLDAACAGKIKPVELPDRAYQKPKRGEKPCTVGVCEVCRTEYESNSLLSAVIREDLTTAEADFIRCRTPCQTPPTEEELNVILRDVQVHRWFHSKSCFKITRRNPTGTFCRFQRPVPTNPNDTFINEAQDVVHHRPVGSEYVNPYNETLARLFRCNHDLRLVLSSTSKDVAAYICKYIMKPQNRIENETALALATYEHAVNSTNARIEPTEDNARSRGNSVYASWLYHLTNQQDVAASLAALFILRESAFWFSHDVTRVHLQQLLSTFDGSDRGESCVQVSPEIVQRDVPVFEYVNALQNYWKRPTTMEDLCLVDVVECYDHKAGQYLKRDTRRVVVLCGKALPDIEATPEPAERERYYKTITMLFKPSRGPNEMLSAPRYEELYQDFITHGPPRAVEHARIHTRRLADSFNAKRASADTEDAPVGQRSTTYSSTAGLAVERPEHDEPHEELTLDGAANSSPIPTIDQQFARYNDVLQADQGVQVAIQDTARRQLACYNEAQHRVFAHDDAVIIPAVSESATHGTTEFLRTFCTRESQLRQIEAYMNPIPWVNPAGAPQLHIDSLHQFASIQDISRAFQLNLHQHIAFETTARHVLCSYAKDIADEGGFIIPAPSPASGLKKQLVGFLGGEAGTGKSRVIHALLRFAKLWQREGSIEAVAYTGVAANNIDGKTVHSSRNIPVHAGKRCNISEEMRSKFSKVVLTICDEVSMLPQSLLGRANAATSELVPPDVHEVWGGRHLLFCGDWMQLPPVKARACYSTAGDAHGHAARKGYDVYREINRVFFLMENMRNRLDSTYTNILSRIRWGRTTAQDIATLNTRVRQPVATGRQTPWYFHPIVVPTNQQRCAINHRMTYETAACHGAKIYECLATPTTARSIPTLKNVQHLDDSCTERIPLKLLYFFGMPVMLSQRSTPSEYATANGTLAFVAGHELVDENDACALEERNGCTVHVLRRLPRRLILHLRGSTVRYDSVLPPGYLYIDPIPKSIEVDIPHASQPHGSRKRPRSPTLTIRQFAIVPAFACTPERLQGMTCHDGITLSKLERAKIPPQSLYVALSRTTTLNKLVLTHPVDRAFLGTFKPQKAAVAEITRLISKLYTPP